MTPIPDAVLPPEPEECTLFGPKEKKIMDLCNLALEAMIRGDWPEYERVMQEIERMVGK